MHRKNGVPIIVPHREPQGTIDHRVYCTERGALCLGCPYPKHGFICWFNDGTCLKTETNRIMAGKTVGPPAKRSFAGERRSSVASELSRQSAEVSDAQLATTTCPA